MKLTIYIAGPIAWAVIGAIVQIVVVSVAYFIGRYRGYWERVEEEKFTKGGR